MAKITLYHDQSAAATCVPNIFIDQYMTRANGEYVKIYLYLLRCFAQPSADFSLSGLADHFDCTERDILRALKYWAELVFMLFIGVFICPLDNLQIGGGCITGDRLHHGFVMLLFGFHSGSCLLLFQMNQNRAFLKIDLPAIRAQADAQRLWPLLQLQKPLLCQYVEADARFSRA